MILKPCTCFESKTKRTHNPWHRSRHKMTGYGVIRTVGTVPELLAIGAIDLSKYDDHYLKAEHIFERTAGIIDEYHPDELAIEAPFFGKKRSVDAKAWKAQGAAIAAALTRSLPIFEYAPER